MGVASSEYIPGSGTGGHIHIFTGDWVVPLQGGQYAASLIVLDMAQRL
jgi:hypothetical protein